MNYFINNLLLLIVSMRGLQFVLRTRYCYIKNNFYLHILQDFRRVLYVNTICTSIKVQSINILKRSIKEEITKNIFQLIKIYLQIALLQTNKKTNRNPQKLKKYIVKRARVRQTDSARHLLDGSGTSFWGFRKISSIKYHINIKTSV